MLVAREVYRVAPAPSRFPGCPASLDFKRSPKALRREARPVPTVLHTKWFVTLQSIVPPTKRNMPPTMVPSSCCIAGRR